MMNIYIQPLNAKLQRIMQCFVDGVRVCCGGCEGHGWRGGALGERALPMRAHRSASLPWRCAEDNSPYLRHDCGEAKRGRAVCPHTAVNALVARSTAAARQGRLALPCGHRVGVTLPAAVSGWSPRANSRESDSCAGRMPVKLTKYIRRRYIFHVKLCNRRDVDCIRYCNRNALIDMPRDNRDSCLMLSLSNSVAVRSLIYKLSLQLDCRNATICGQGGKSHV